MKTLAIAISLLSLSALAQTPERNSPAASGFCEARTNPRALQAHVSDFKNQLSFLNQGGLLGGGVCWWHSRFTRAAAYLAVFDPALPKPNDEEAKKIISRLRERKGMTLIPGYRSLYEFSVDHSDRIQSKLNDWQRSDALLKASWVKGLSGSTEITNDKLSVRMDELYTRISNGEVVYQMLQMPSVIAHAWLVSGMEKTSDGYKLTVIDSNAGTDTFYYRNGMTSMNYHGYWDFVPYTHQTKEERKLLSKMTEFCTGAKPSQEEGEEESL